MSRENVELVRWALDAFNRGEYDAESMGEDLPGVRLVVHQQAFHTREEALEAAGQSS